MGVTFVSKSTARKHCTLGLCGLFDFCVFDGRERTVDVLSANGFISHNLEVIDFTGCKSRFGHADGTVVLDCGDFRILAVL